MAFLRVLTPSELQDEIQIRQRIVTVGSAPENSIVIDHPTIAPIHISLIDEGGSCLLIDHSSKRGTFVDGVRVTKKRLQNGNRIRLADHAEILFTTGLADSVTSNSKRLVIANDQADGPISDIQKKITLQEAGFDHDQDLSEKILKSEIQQKHLSAIYQVNQSITEILDPTELAETVLDLIFQIFPIDRAAVVLYDIEAESSKPIAFKARAETDEHEPVSVSKTIIGKVIFEKSAVLAEDTYLDARFKDISSITRRSIRSVMCVPLHTKGKILGALYADALNVPGKFSEDDLRLLLAVAGALANSIENARLIDRVKRDERKLSTLERYLPSVVVEHLFHQEDSIELGGKHAAISALFADIRGFTSLAERNAPAEVVNRLNDYFTSMSEIVFKHGGTLGEYIGDEIMAYFGAPLERNDHASKTISVALEMMNEMESLKKRWRRTGLPVFDIGIGIASGEVIAGNIGSSKQMKYTIIGNAVNIASRLCANAKPGEILISEETHEKAGKPTVSVFYEKIALRGISRPIDVYKVTR